MVFGLNDSFMDDFPRLLGGKVYGLSDVLFKNYMRYSLCNEDNIR